MKFVSNLLVLNRLVSSSTSSPVWIRQKCGEMLSSAVLEPDHHGVRRILLSVLEATTSNDRLRVSLGKIFSTCPKNVSKEFYVEFLSVELVELFYERNLRPIIVETLKQMHKNFGRIVENRIFDEIFRRISSFDELKNLDEKSLTVLIDDLDDLTGDASFDSIRRFLVEKFFANLTTIFFLVENSLFFMKKRFFDVFQRLFSALTVEETSRNLLEMISDPKQFSIRFEPDENGNFRIFQSQNERIEIEQIAETLFRLVSTIERRDEIVMKIFLELLRNSTKKTERNSDFLWTEQEKLSQINQIVSLKFLEKLTAFLSENVEFIVQNLDETIEIVEIIFSSKSDDELLQMAMTICSFLLTHYDQVSATEDK